MNSPKRLSAEQITAMTAAATHRVIAAKSPSDIRVIAVIQLPVTDVLFYEKNPRRHDNLKYEEIKESIRIRGLESALYVTKRPGSNQYMLARGGKTRLKALQALAEEDSAKWGKLDFHEIPWVSESEILAAHLVENTGREAMCFWDLAEGIDTLRKQIEQETGKAISTRNLPALLKGRGVEVGLTTAWAGEFSLGYLQALGPWKPHLPQDHVDRSIRPRFITLKALWLLAFSDDEGGFKSVVDQAIGECVSETAPYSLEALMDAVLAGVAKALDVAQVGLLHAVRVQENTPIQTEQEFRAIASGVIPGNPETQSEEADFASVLANQQAQSNGSSDGAGMFDTGGSLGGQAQDATSPNPPTKVVPQISEETRRNLNRLMGSATNRATDVPGIPGVSVAKGLIPREYKAPGQRKAEGIHGWPLTQEELALLEQDGQIGFAKRVMSSELMAFGDLVSISSLIIQSDSPYLPVGFYVEMPEPGRLGSSPEDLAVQAWWLLAAISRQCDPRVLPNLLGPDASGGTGETVFRSTQPGSFAIAVLDQESLDEAIATCLGGQQISGFDLLMEIITHRDHPMHRVTLGVLDACATWNAAKGAS